MWTQGKALPVILAATLLTGLVAACGRTVTSAAPNATITAPSPLNIPITVSEALPLGISGKDRNNEIVTVGVPVADSDHISTVSQLGFTAVSAAQFRITGRYPDGNAKWILVDVPASVAAGQSIVVGALTTGTGSFGGPALATDGAAITVNTGAATFVIKKTSFNIFESVVVGGAQLVSPGNSGRIEAKGTDGTRYTSANDTPRTAIIEENGPVRAAIKVMGTLRSSAGSRLLDYTLRLHFYKGKEYVKGQIFLRNADATYPQSVVLSNAEMIVPLTISGTKTATFSLNDTSTVTPLSPGTTAHLYQGYNANPARAVTLDNNCNYWDPPVLGTCVSGTFTPDPTVAGIEILSGSTTLHSLGTNTDLTQGYASFNDASGKGANLAMRWMSSYWPSGFEVHDTGEVSIEFYSKFNGGKPEKYPFIAMDSDNGAFGHHERREVLWDFHTQAIDPTSTLYTLQYPMVGRASLDQYMQTKAIFGQSEFVTPAQQNQFFTDYGRTPPSLANPAMDIIYRAWQWTLGSGLNQTDFPMQDLLDFIRTGYGGFYLLGEQRTQWNTDTQIARSDYIVGYPTKVWAGADPLPTSKGVTGTFIELDHAHIVSTPFYYFISGDEAIKDGFIDYGEYLQFQQLRGVYAIPNMTNTDLRSVSRKLRNMTLAYEFTCQTGSCNQDYKNTLATAIAGFMDYRDNPALGTSSPVGRDLSRGSFWWDSFLSTQEGGYRVEHSLYVIPIWFDALWHLQRVMKDTGWNYSRQSDVEDFLTGLAHWIIDEWLTYYPSGAPGAGAAYKYKHDYNYKLDVSPSLYPDTHYLYYTMGRAADWAFQHTGDATYLTEGGWLTWESSEGGFATRTNGVMRGPSELQDQALMYSYFNSASMPTWHFLPLAVVDQGGGSYTLTWTVPSGAQEYRIKYSSTPIVEWLGFDKFARTFVFDPTQYTAFFAATNIPNNPIPSPAGSTQTITLTGLPLGQQFSAKVKTRGL